MFYSVFFNTSLWPQTTLKSGQMASPAFYTEIDEITQLRKRYAAATAKREWAHADLIAALASRDAEVIRAAQAAEEQAVREWESALTELEAHVTRQARLSV